MIPQGFIDDLLARTDIVELIRTRVELRRAGRDWEARCPFHDEKTPSFTVAPAKQFYHCFGCGAHGNAIGFLMEFERLEFPAAVEQLAQLAGIEMPREDEQQEKRDSTAPLFAALGEAQQLFQRWLGEHEQARAYLAERGLNDEVVQTFAIGYAPPGWNALSGRLRDGRAAEAAGLLVRKDSGEHYDRFRCRLMFPIRDLRGRTVGFGGRSLDGDKAKYLNSPETPVFHKGRLVYGLYEARQASRKLDQLLVVEGYMDVIALAQFGFPSAVATLGTATTAEHLQLLLRQCRRITFAFDGDAAGRRAAHKALDEALPVMRDDSDFRFLFLPEGDDPDTLIRREGESGFRQRLDNAQALSALLLERLSKDLDLDTADGQAALLSRAREALEPVQAQTFREILLERISSATGLRNQRVGTLLGKARGQARRPRRTVSAPQRMTPVRRAVALLLEFPTVCAAADPAALAASAEPGAALLADLIQRCQAQPAIRCAGLVQAYADRPEGEHLERLALLKVEVDEEAAQREFGEICARLTSSTSAERERLAELKRRRPGELNPQEREELAALTRRNRRQP